MQHPLHDLHTHIHATIHPMEGWCTTHKAISMADLIIEQQLRLAVEVGVFGGRSLVPMAMAFQHLGAGTVVGIDPWSRDAAAEGSNDDANNTWWADLTRALPPADNTRLAIDYPDCRLEQVHRACMHTIRAKGLEPHCLVIRGRAEHAAALWGEGTLDLVHIDGNHSELASTRDVALWLPRIAPGRYLWFDDTHWATTQPALRLVEEQCDLIDTHDEAGGQQNRLYRKRS